MTHLSRDPFRVAVAVKLAHQEPVIHSLPVGESCGCCGSPMVLVRPWWFCTNGSCVEYERGMTTEEVRREAASRD